MRDCGAQPAGPAEHPRDLGDGVRHVVDVVQAHVRHGKIKGPVPEGEAGRVCQHDRPGAGVTASKLDHGRRGINPGNSVTQ
jgi:hypothetical protein